MTFYDFMIMHHLGDDSPAGDFAGDMQRDDRFPKDGKYVKIRRHLYEAGACRECMETFVECWKEYIHHD